MKLVCMTQVWNQNTYLGWDGKSNIQRFMESVVKYCDGLVAFDDGSTDDSRDVITSFSSQIELEIPSNKENEPFKEGYHRARSLEHCKRLGADWVVCLDPDEIFEPKVERGALRALCEAFENMKFDSALFRRRDLWRTDRYLRLDNHWSQSAGIRLFKLNEDVSYNTDFGIRGCLCPSEGIVSYTSSALKIAHFGYSTDEQIIHRYKRFKKLGVDLTLHLDDTNVRLCDVSDSLGVQLKGPGIEVYNKHLCEILRVASL